MKNLHDNDMSLIRGAEIPKVKWLLFLIKLHRKMNVLEVEEKMNYDDAVKVLNISDNKTSMIKTDPNHDSIYEYEIVHLRGTLALHCFWDHFTPLRE